MVLKALLSIFLPEICHVCGEKLLPGEKFVCEQCISRLPLTGYERYWLNNSTPNSHLNPMERRFAGQLPMERCCSAFFYNRDSALATLVHDFKYRGFSRLATRLGFIAAESLLPSGFFDSVDILLPVPLHWRKQLKRGYNQSEMIAEGVSRATGIPVGKQLIATRPHKTQTSLSSDQRIANTKDIFAVRHPETLNGKRIMLVDDICTTGATLLSAGIAVAASAENIRLRLFTLGVV